MLGETKQATSAKTSLIYLTVGALTVVWSIIYYVYLSRSGGGELSFLWCYGFIFTGIVLVAIGLAVGSIGRSAMPAEVASTPGATIVPTGSVTRAATTTTVQPVAGQPVAAQPVQTTQTVPRSPVAPVQPAPTAAAHI